VLHIDNRLRDRYSDEDLSLDDNFINSLYHEGIIVNISALKKKHRDELEILLGIFDQNNRTKNIHIMNIVEQELPEKFRPIIRRLQAAAQVKEVKEAMELEDDFTKEIMEYEERILISDLGKAEAQRERDQERKLKEDAIKDKYETIDLMLEHGIDAKVISKKLGMSLAEIEEIQKKKMK